MKNKRSSKKRKSSEDDILQQNAIEHMVSNSCSRLFSNIFSCILLTSCNLKQSQQDVYLDGQACSITVQVSLFLILLFLVNT